MTTSQAKRLLRPLLAAPVIASLVALSACGSGSSGAKGSSSGTDPKAGVSAAKTAVNKTMQPPTTIGVSQPLKNKPAAGKTYVFLGVPFGSVGYNIAGLQAAAAATGWNVKVLQYDQTNPATLLKAFQQALQYHPVAVSLTGIDYKYWKSVIPDYRKAGVSIIPDCDPTPLSDVVIANVCAESDFAKMGTTMANWVVADSNGSGHALVVHTPDFPILESLAKSFTTKVKDSCPNCSTKELQLNVAQATGGEASLIVSALQRDPSINYVVQPFSQFGAGLPAALQSAGLASRVKIVLQGPTKQDLVDLKAGKVAAVMPLASSYQGWLDMDVALRHEQGLKFPLDDGGLPTQLLTPKSTFSQVPDYTEPSDFPAQFKKLWKLG